MKVKISFEGCEYEEANSIKIVTHAKDLFSAIENAREFIRSRIKWKNDISEEEVTTLEELQEILYVEGVSE